MIRNTRRTQKGEPSLTRESIIEAAIALLDGGGESGLTFRALSERLSTGAGAIYWHIASKSELLTAACDAIVAGAMGAAAMDAAPREAIRAIALALFDAIDAHPWVGSALTKAPGQLPTIRILERIGQQADALGVPDGARWATVSALLSYILGVAGQNAANRQVAQESNAVRSLFLDTVASVWSRLDADVYPFTRSVAGQLREHDDRADFLFGIELILKGIAAPHSG